MTRAIIVVDMLRGFLEKEYPLYCGEEARKIIPNIQKLLKDMQSEGATIIYLSDNHDLDDREFQIFPSHCIKGTEESEIIPELSEFSGIIVPKKTYSGFYNTDLEKILEQIQPDEVIVVGVCTDICVMHTVADLYQRKYPIIIYEDCVASFDKNAHEFALKHINNVFGVKIINKYNTNLT